MATTQYFEQIRDTMPEGLERQLLAYMIDHGHVGKAHPVKKETLTLALLGKHNSTTDRQIRLAVRSLRVGWIEGEHDAIEFEAVPVLASSGAAGYYLAGNLAEIEEFSQELGSRWQDLRETWDASHAWRLPAQLTEHVPQQMGLF